LTPTVLTRVFVYGTARLTDPDPALTPAQAKDFYSAIHPELTTADVQGPVPNGDNLEYTFKKAAGTKG
jgi:PRTRC genetic system protein C